MAVRIQRMPKPTMNTRADTQPAEETGDSFEFLFNTHWSRVCSLVYRLVGDPDVAEDLALEAFWKMYRSFHFDRDGQNPGGWLYRTAMNLGYNHLRAQARRRQHEQHAGRLALEPDAESNPALAAEKLMESELVRQALSGLKPRSAQVLVLRHSGLSYIEIAAALRVSPGSIGTLLARAEQEFERSYRKLEGSKP